MNKIFSLKNLQKIIFRQKKNKKKIVLCHGVFDLLHVGHIKHFQEAKSLGDKLVVTITTDNLVNKGLERPYFNQKLRAEAIAALDVVDYVAINNTPSAIFPLNTLKPNFYCKGPDYKNHQNDVSGQIKSEIKVVKKIGGKVIYTNDITFSSSRLLNKYAEIYNDHHKSLINEIKKKYKFPKIRKLVENFKKIKVLVIGETIIDQYIFCEALGKSGKEPVLALRDLNYQKMLILNI